MPDLQTKSLFNYLPDVGSSSRLDAAPDPTERPGGSDAVDHVENYVAFRIEDAIARASLMVDEAMCVAAEQRKAAHSVWSSECQDRVVAEAASARSAFERTVSQVLVDILAPFIAQRQRARVRAAFVARLTECLAEAPDITTVVDGPTEDCSIVVGSLGKLGVRTVSRFSEEERLQAEIGTTILRADLSKWPAKFAAVFDEIGGSDG